MRSGRRIGSLWTRVVMMGWVVVASFSAAKVEAAESGYRVARVVESAEAGGEGELAVSVAGVELEGERREKLPVRVIVTAGDGSHPDGGGRGLYEDGRFFAEGSFVVRAAAGRVKVELRAGPNFVPLTFEVELERGKRTEVEAELAEWFSPERLGWLSGDNHVHTQHDTTAAVKTDLVSMALQARANGLSWVTEAGSNTSYELIDKLDTDRFLLRYAPELRPGAFIGHINTPGIDEPLSWGEWTAAQKKMLPVYHLLDEVHERGGIVIHTHPLTPVTQLHWMGATEILSDGVLGRTADLLDQDYPATRQLYYTLLNLGNRIGVSGYTDAALGRVRTMAPGDRRVYAKAGRLNYGEIVRAMGGQRTVATSGGPLFVELDVAGEGPGGTVRVERDGNGGARVKAAVTIYSLNALKEATVMVNGRPAARLDVRGKSGRVEVEAEVELGGERAAAGLADWVLVYVEAEPNHWAMTSPVWVEGGDRGRPDSSVLVLQVSNAERLSKLTRDFFAHLIVTVSPGRTITAVELLRDGEPIHTFDPADGDRLHEGLVPVSEMPGPYGPGWAWHRIEGMPVHFQADWPVTRSGWYAVRVNDGEGTESSDALYFDAGYPMSRQMSVANLRSSFGDRFTLHGYGEEMPLAEIPEPWEGDRWWYPRQTWWRMETRLGGFEHELRGGSFERAGEWFRAAE